MWGVLHRHNDAPSMIIEEVDIERLAILEAKYDAPIGSHSDRPESFQGAPSMNAV
jgi:hypothetical protein